MEGREYYGQDNRDAGMLAKLRGLLAAFLLMLVLTFSVVGVMSGMLFISESYDDIRQAGVDQWNADVDDWNVRTRAEFSQLDFTIGAQKVPMQDNHTEEVYDILMAYDAHPEELAHPKALFYTSFIDISGIKARVDNQLQLLFQVGDKQHEVDVPVVFEETRCRYVQRGKMSRQICDEHYFALQSVCFKVDLDGEPSKTIDGVRGASPDIGCFMGTEGMYRPRLTHIWSPGIYKEYRNKAALEEDGLPDELQIDIRSNSDPALTASLYTAGFYDFGESPGVKFVWGVVLLCVSSGILGFLMCMCSLNYIWPSAPNNTERLKYFYRRYLRKRHQAADRWWAANVAGGEPQMPDVSQDVLLSDEPAQWAGPHAGGHRLDGPPAGAPPGGPAGLVQSV